MCHWSILKISPEEDSLIITVIIVHCENATVIIVHILLKSSLEAGMSLRDSNWLITPHEKGTFCCLQF